MNLLTRTDDNLAHALKSLLVERFGNVGIWHAVYWLMSITKETADTSTTVVTISIHPDYETTVIDLLATHIIHLTPAQTNPENPAVYTLTWGTIPF